MSTCFIYWVLVFYTIYTRVNMNTPSHTLICVPTQTSTDFIRVQLLLSPLYRGNQGKALIHAPLQSSSKNTFFPTLVSFVSILQPLDRTGRGGGLGRFLHVSKGLPVSRVWSQFGEQNPLWSHLSVPSGQESRHPFRDSGRPRSSPFSPSVHKLVVSEIHP